MSYGAVEASNGESRDTEALSSFQESDMLYVKDRPLSKGERWRKRISAILPILVGVIIVYLFAAFSLRAVRPISSYNQPPVHAADSESTFDTAETTTSVHRGPPIGSPTLPPASPKGSSATAPPLFSSGSSSSSSHGSSPSSCAANKGCAKLDLIGSCCPTTEGKKF